MISPGAATFPGFPARIQFARSPPGRGPIKSPGGHASCGSLTAAHGV